jgi:opacity protein-like surface antigen
MKPSIIAASTILLSASIAVAGTTIPSLTDAELITTTESGWHVRGAMYGWATALTGDVTLAGNKVPVDVGFNDVLDKLDYAVMAAVEVGNGKWSFLADVFYAQLSTSNSKSNILGTTQFDGELTQFIGNFMVIYNVVDTKPTRFDVYAGARVNSMDTDININGPILNISRSASKTWVDPIIGFRYQRELSDKFFIRALGDIGGFGVQSDLTWQAMAAVGYRLNDNASVALGYRSLGTDYSDGGFTYDVVAHGMLLGVEYSF